jgi:CheY-like chemotaxis protein
VKTILIVEDERGTLLMLRKALVALRDCAVVTAENGSEALKVLQQEAVDLVVTDLQMPVLDGFGLIAIMQRQYPMIPVIVMTGLHTSEAQKAEDLGALRVMPKPIVMQTLHQEVLSALEKKNAGLIKGLTMANLMQLLHWELKTCTMTVKSRGRVGMLYVEKGELIHAHFREHYGERAALEILSWEQSEVEFVNECRMDRTINKPTALLVMEAAMHKDEKQM